MSDFKNKMHQIWFLLRLCPRPRGAHRNGDKGYHPGKIFKFAEAQSPSAKTATRRLISRLASVVNVSSRRRRGVGHRIISVPPVINDIYRSAVAPFQLKYICRNSAPLRSAPLQLQYAGYSSQALSNCCYTIV